MLAICQCRCPRSGQRQLPGGESAPRVFREASILLFYLLAISVLGCGAIDVEYLQPDTATDGGVDSDTGCSPGPEVCDGVDNDCNLAVDDTPAMTQLCPEDQTCIDGACIQLPAEQECIGYQFSTHAYALCSAAVDWDTAKARCEQMSAHLATIGSEEEDLAVKTLAPGKQVDAWIGLRRLADACNWEWVTLEPVRYTAWPPDYPDGACGVYDCCQIWSKEDAQWDDTYCTDEQPYICEWEPT